MALMVAGLLSLTILCLIVQYSITEVKTDRRRRSHYNRHINYDDDGQIILSDESFIKTTAYPPIVFWHGLGDECCNNQSLSYVSDVIVKTLVDLKSNSIKHVDIEDLDLENLYTKVNKFNDLYSIMSMKSEESVNNERSNVLHDSDLTFIYSVSTGETENDDRKSGFFGYIWDQVEATCKELSSIPELTESPNGINFVGFSQGGLFIRALIATCPALVPKNVVTYGTPNAGISHVPNCEGKLGNSIYCRLATSLLTRGAYLDLVQRRVVPAQYFRKYDNPQEYMTKSLFLPFIDGEVDSSDREFFKNQMLQIQKYAMIQFNDDKVINPKESAHFGVYDENHVVVSLKDRPWYINDTMGFRTLDERGSLFFLDQDGDHMRIDMDLLVQNIIPNFLV